MNNHTHSNGWLFTESQRFLQWWMWSSVALGIFLFVFALFTGKSVLESGIENPGEAMSVICFLIVMLVTILIALLRLDVKINDIGVYYRFIPLQQNFRLREWSRVEKAYVRKYKPLSDYGGWGLRFINLFGKGTAYNVSGNKGLQLELKNGKKFLLGTQKSDEMQRVIDILRDKKVISES